MVLLLLLLLLLLFMFEEAWALFLFLVLGKALPWSCKDLKMSSMAVLATASAWFIDMLLNITLSLASSTIFLILRMKFYEMKISFRILYILYELTL